MKLRLQTDWKLLTTKTNVLEVLWFMDRLKLNELNKDR